VVDVGEKERNGGRVEEREKEVVDVGEKERRGVGGSGRDRQSRGIERECVRVREGEEKEREGV
jgi:hypothetical protein